MSEERPEELEREFESWVIAYHDALRTSSTVSMGPQTPRAELLPRAERTRKCLELLERVLPRRGSETGVNAQPVPTHIGRFEIRRELGRGGFGIVFLAFDPKLGREVALKVPRGETLIDAHLRQRFVWEAQTAAGLSHAHIVQVYEGGEAGALPYLACEYCPGITLAQWLEEHKKPAPARSVAGFIAVLAEAVHYVHSRGILHRDLKPSNILLASVVCSPSSVANDQETPATSYGLWTTDYGLTPKITDFGLAKVLEGAADQTRSGTAVGTTRYMAPEQVLGRRKEIGWQTDVYALGVILYELLTGRPPFVADSDQETQQQILDKEPASPSRLARGMPHDLQIICLKCLQKEPRKRYASAADLAEDLRRFLAGKPIRARRTPVWEHAEKWVKRRPGMAASIAAIVLITSAGLAGIGWFALEASREAMAKKVAREAAETQEYYSVLANIRESIANPGLGWKSKSLDDLERVGQFRIPMRNVVELRNHAAICFAGLDLKRVWTVENGINASCLAFSPDGKYLAVAEAKRFLVCHVQLYNVAKRELVCEFPVSDSWNTGENGIRCLAFSPDGNRLLAGTRIGRIYAWDLRQSNSKKPWRAHRGGTTGLAFLPPDGKVVVSAGTDGWLKAWNAENGELIGKPYPCGKEGATLAFSPDGSRLAFSSPWHSLELLDASRLTEGIRAVQRLGRIRGTHADVCFSPEGRLIAESFGSRILLLPPEKFSKDLTGNEHAWGELPYRIWPASGDSTAPPAHDGGIDHLEFNWDGSLLVSGGADRRFKLWETATGRLLFTSAFGERGRTHPAFSPKGDYLAVTAESKTILYKVDSSQELTTVGSQPFVVRAFALSPDGQILNCLAHEKLALVAPHLFDLTTWSTEGRELRQPEHLALDQDFRRSRPCLTRHPKERVLAFVGDGNSSFRVWGMDGGKPPEVVETKGVVKALRFAPDGRTLWGILDEGENKPDRIVSWCWPSREFVPGWRNPDPMFRHLTGIECLAVGQELLVVGTGDSTIKLFRANDSSRCVRSWNSRGGIVRSVALSADGTLVASGTDSGVIQVFRVQNDEPVSEWKAHADAVQAVAFSPDGKLLATGSRDRQAPLRLWQQDGESFRELMRLPANGPIEQLDFTSDGTKLAILVQNERAVRIWHLHRLRESLRKLNLDWEALWSN